MSTNHAIITGASQGIGRAMARECASRGIPVLLVALDQPILQETATEIREEFGVPVDTLGIDLTEECAASQVVEWLDNKGYQVNILINNAGFGRNGVHDQLPLEEYLTMIRLNNMAMVSLTYRMLPKLRETGKAHILNMSSMESALPLPYKAVYTGTKAFVYNYSLSLGEELREENISVTVVCPGPVATNEDSLKRIQTQGKKARIIVLMPEEVAARAIPAMLAGKRVVLPGTVTHLVTRISKVFPTGTKMSLLGRMFSAYKKG